MPVLVATLAALNEVHGQTAAPLADYVGTYTISPGYQLEIIAGRELFAIVDDAKYLLRRAGSDRFLNAIGDTVLFARDASGRVDGYIERGAKHSRITAQVTEASAALAWPRGSDTIGATYVYQVPADRGDGIPTGDIRASDLDVATAERLVNGVLDGTHKDVHGVLLFQRGKLVLEEYFYGYTADRTHQLRSATKSIVGALAGIAIDRGVITGVDAPVTATLPYTSFANPDQRKATITLGALLTMRPGLACNDEDPKSPGREVTLYDAPDWVKATLDLPMVADPGTVAHYCSGSVAVAGRMIERAAGMTLPEFAQAHLFTPLGIARATWRWNYVLTNADREFAQIHLRPRDMLKLGMLYAGGGMWRGARVVSDAWTRASLAEQTRIDGTGYGYLWWRPWLNVETPSGARRVEFSAAQGNGGQKIYIVPELELVAVFTGGDYNSGASPPNRIMAQVILPRLLAARGNR
ncbi:MAG TPA: serine hydrolase [Gemmatimonadaceae bacterium]|nr:serine hydrolase [Gemmatimonadaceae bacterium]